MNVTRAKVKLPLGGNPAVNAWFLDDNVFLPTEQDNGFWVRGRSRAEFLLRAPVVDDAASGRVRALTMPRVEVVLETGAVPNRVTIDGGAGKHVVDVPAHNRRSVLIEMSRGLPYHPDPADPMNYVYRMAIDSGSGFIPMFWEGGRDPRYLGVFVRVLPIYE
jgi:hypothetical protein